MTHFRKLMNPNYLGTYSLDDGKDIVLTIDQCRQEVVQGSDGQKETCLVCHFREDVKPMILNSTNAKMIAKLLKTPYIEEWAGHRIQIGSEKVKAFGDVVDALRVRKQLPADEKPVACESCGQIIQPAYNMSPAQLAAYTKKKFGKCLCADCAKAMTGETKTGEKKEEAKSEAAEGNQE